ncbi:MAG: hypothetical protein Q9M91_00195 [Candidatus Dojkabacteria bacterium]|nr:hypothetical protein [Candidatus Dojkabacteria bacterium]MDQ7020252.1 hypothetical protein [Candidatus Dojkabacteria bacterium]
MSQLVNNIPDTFPISEDGGFDASAYNENIDQMYLDDEQFFIIGIEDVSENDAVLDLLLQERFGNGAHISGIRQQIRLVKEFSAASLNKAESLGYESIKPIVVCRSYSDQAVLTPEGYYQIPVIGTLEGGKAPPIPSKRNKVEVFMSLGKFPDEISEQDFFAIHRAALDKSAELNSRES